MRHDPATTMDAGAPAAAFDASQPAPSPESLRRVHHLGRYELLFPIAKGGMGEVYAARLVGLHGVERLVAIKTLRIASGVHRAALLTEARVTSRVHHPNVVATLDLDEVDDVPYIVMELIDGVSLSKLLQELEQRGEMLSPVLAAWVAMQCALGLHAAHELTDGEGRPLGLVHRDVSPQNILLAATGEVKVADFGIAKFVGREEQTTQGQIRGKLPYMSPEHVLRDELDRRSDIFSLGIVLWESLTGQRLFAASNPARTLTRVREFAPPSPSELRRGVSTELATVVLRCLEKDRDKRYATCAEVADALRAALRAEGAHVDGSDLATLVQGLFAGERADLARRIASGATGPAAPAMAPLEHSSAPRRGRMRHAVLAVSLFAAAAMGAGAALARHPSAPTAVTPAASTLVPAPPLSQEAATGPAMTAGLTSSAPLPGTTSPPARAPIAGRKSGHTTRSSSGPARGSASTAGTPFSSL